MTIRADIVAILFWLGRVEVVAAVLALLIVLLRTGLRRMTGPRWAAALWLALLPRLLLPVLPGSSLSLSRWIDSAWARLRPDGGAVEVARAPAPAVNVDARWTINLTPLGADSTAASRTPAIGLPADHPTMTARDWMWPAALLAVWGCVAVAMIARLVIINARFAGRVAATARPAPDALQQLLAECAGKMRLNRVPRLLLCDAVAAPSLAGLFRPAILLPEKNGASDDELRWVFLHELSHFKCRDLWLDWTWAVARAVHWFNPVVWLARRAYRADRELARDAMVLNVTGPARASDYGQAILRMATAIRPSISALRPIVAGIVERGATLRRRISMIARFEDGAANRPWVAWPVLIFAFAIACTDQRTAQPVTEKAANSVMASGTKPAPASTIDQLVSVARDEINHGDYQDPVSLIDEILTEDPNNAFAAGARQLVQDKAILQEQRAFRESYNVNTERQYLIRDGDRVVKTETDLGQVDPFFAVQAQLNQVIPLVNFEATPLTNVGDFFRRVTGANIFINWRALEQVGIDRNTPVSVRMSNVKFSKALTAVLQKVGGNKAKMGYNVDQGVITISTRDDLDTQIETRLYDVRDLLAQMPAALSASSTAPGVAVGSPLSHDQIVDTLIRQIMTTVDPDSWKDRGGKLGTILESQGQFIITQTDLNQAFIYDFLHTIRAHWPYQIAVRMQFITVFRSLLRSQPPGALRELADLSGKPGARMMLDPSQVQALLQVVKGDRQCSIIASPQILAFSGQWANIEIGQNLSYFQAYNAIVHPDGSTVYEPETETIHSGISVDTQATSSADQRTVSLVLHPKLTEVDGFKTVPLTGAGGKQLTVQQPITRVWQMRPTITMPSSSTMALAGFDGPSSDVALGGEVPTTQSNDVVGPLPGQTLYLLVTPAILVNGKPVVGDFSAASQPAGH